MSLTLSIHLISLFSLINQVDEGVQASRMWKTWLWRSYLKSVEIQPHFCLAIIIYIPATLPITNLSFSQPFIFYAVVIKFHKKHLDWSTNLHHSIFGRIIGICACSIWWFLQPPLFLFSLILVLIIFICFFIQTSNSVYSNPLLPKGM